MQPTRSFVVLMTFALSSFVTKQVRTANTNTIKT